MTSQVSKYGRIPQQTVDVIQRTIRTIETQVILALPAAAGSGVRAFTLEAVLDSALRDWREHDNTRGLSQEDLTDLQSYVALAANLADGDLAGPGLPVYQATLTALLERWLAGRALSA